MFDFGFPVDFHLQTNPLNEDAMNRTLEVWQIELKKNMFSARIAFQTQSLGVASEISDDTDMGSPKVTHAIGPQTMM